MVPLTLEAQVDRDDDYYSDESQHDFSERFALGPRLGYYTSSDSDEGSFYGGIQARYRLSPAVGLEGAVEYHTAQDYLDGNVRVSLLPVTASLLFFLPINVSVNPYGMAGIGAYYTMYDYADEVEQIDIADDTDFNMGYHLGFGMELAASENVSFNVDYRYLFLNPDTNEGSLEDTDFSGNVFTLSLMFYM